MWMRIIYGSHLHMLVENHKSVPERIAERWRKEREKIYK